MKLRNQGPVRPAPELTGHMAALAAIVRGWPGVDAFTHWRLGSPGIVDGAEFHAGDDELGHIHLDATAHVLLDGTLCALLVERGLGRCPSWSHAWITQPVRSAADVDHAAWLLRLAYDRQDGVSDRALMDRVRAFANALQEPAANV